MDARNQYLKEVRAEYLKTKSKKRKGKLLNEAQKRTKLNRKYLLEKLKPKSNLDKDQSPKKKRPPYYDNAVKPALVKMWQIFDRPCGQRLETSLKEETERLRQLGELICSDTTAGKLKQMSSATIDRKLKHQKEVERIKGKYHKKIHPLLYQQIPVKVFAEQDRLTVGNLQIDLVEHCGSSAAGDYVNTLDIVDIYSGWTEQGAILGKGQAATRQELDNCRRRSPFEWSEIHSDGGTNFINNHLFRYAAKTGLGFSRSRPYKKNDNCLVEQKNNTHVRRLVGYLRYDTKKEVDLLNDLYSREQRLYKNFFSPVIKLVAKERIGGRLRRVYDQPKTPYARLMELDNIAEAKKSELRQIYLSLNPALLKRTIDKKLDNLHEFYRRKNDKEYLTKVDLKKKFSVRFFDVSRMPVSVR